jgi:hypothetical protein
VDRLAPALGRSIITYSVFALDTKLNLPNTSTRAQNLQLRLSMERGQVKSHLTGDFTWRVEKLATKGTENSIWVFCAFLWLIPISSTSGRT